MHNLSSLEKLNKWIKIEQSENVKDKKNKHFYSAPVISMY